ncbi:MAG: amidophosphoribosyltransferase [Thaumarchaeota archaeon]|nr:amidophosphoribosyltransferase [Nitrososphaerota archaeon]
MSEEISEACGIFGAISSEPTVDVFPYLYWGLLSLNHRGQQSYGFTTLRDGKFVKREDLDLIPTDPRIVDRLTRSLKGSVGISNARYATSGKSGIKHLQGGKQPLVVSTRGKSVAISYNGNIVNSGKLRKKLRDAFGRFKTDADTEVLAKHLLLSLEQYSGDYKKAIGEVLDEVEGAYSVMALNDEGEIYAFRDVHGIRPFCFAKKDGIVAFASETPALDINGFEDHDFVQPGELISALPDGTFARDQLRDPKPSLCSFEFAYFSRPDAILNGTDRPVYKIREAFARSIAKAHKEKLETEDVILSMPETADDAAYGLHEATGIPWDRAVRKNRYVTRRAFISGLGNRENVIDKKMNIVGSLVRGKNLAVVEDSIVRGDTTRINIEKLRKAGAKRIDVFVTFPKIGNPCLYGVDMSTYGELIGAKMTPEQISEWMKADSVNYQTIEGLVEAIGLPRESVCTACVTGKYPTPEAQTLADEIREEYMHGKSELGVRVYERRKRTK